MTVRGKVKEEWNTEIVLMLWLSPMSLLTL